MTDIYKDLASLDAEELELFQILLKEQGIGPQKSLIIPQKGTTAHFPLSFAQERLWFLHQLAPESFAYSIPVAYRIKNHLDVKAFEQVVNEIARRHDALRTTFPVIDGRPVQTVSAFKKIELPVIDLSRQAVEDQELEATRLMNEEAIRPFDLAQGPLWRVQLLRLAENDHIVLMTIHHIICDGWALTILVRDVSILYEALSNGNASPLPDLTMQYVDYAVWQRQYLQGEVLQSNLAYWKRQLAGAPTCQVPTDRPRPSIQTYNGARLPVTLSESLTEAIEDLSQRQSSTLFVTLMAGFQLLLHRYSGQNDIVVGTPVAGRDRDELEELIGFFANTLVLRSDVSGNPSFVEQLRRVREAALGAYSNQDVPFEMLVQELRPRRVPNRMVIF